MRKYFHFYITEDIKNYPYLHVFDTILREYNEDYEKFIES